MEVNESVSEFLSRVKELRDKLADVGELVSSNDLVRLTLNEMVSDCQVFITSLVAREIHLLLRIWKVSFYKKRRERSMWIIYFKV